MRAPIDSCRKIPSLKALRGCRSCFLQDGQSRIEIPKVAFLDCNGIPSLTGFAHSLTRRG